MSTCGARRRCGPTCRGTEMPPASEAVRPGRLLVVGTGLIGTSVALAAMAAGYDVLLADDREERVGLAVSMGAGRPQRDAAGDVADLAVVAVPPVAIPQVVAGLLADGFSSRCYPCL